MIDYENRIIYVDNSTLSTFRACKEKARLAHFAGGTPGMGWKSNRPSLPLLFGHAIHAGWAAFYDALAGGYHDDVGNWYLFPVPRFSTIVPLKRAQMAFLRDLGHDARVMPVNVENDERRSLERGLALLEAYTWKWRNEPYENIIVDGRPLVEVGFKYFLGRWYNHANVTEGPWELWYCGVIDRIMRNTISGRPVIFEGKTTTQALPQYIQQCNPNNQVTGYFPGAASLLPDELQPTECIWDCIYVSSRMPDMGKAVKDRFWMYGVDITKDFARQTTMRSRTTIEKFKIDAYADACDYAVWMMKGAGRWPQNTGSCHSYGGCLYRDVCIHNGSREVLESGFVKEEWNPIKKLLERGQ